MGKAIKINDVSFLNNLGSVTFVEAVEIPITGLSISAKPTTIENSYQLQVVYNPTNTTERSIVWSSSNTSVATVSASGLVTVISAGNVTITVKSSVDDTIQDSFTTSCSIANIPVSSVEIVGSAVGEVGGTSQLSATVLPANATNKSIAWSSSNTNIATVSSSGLVTFIAEGTVTITATSVDDPTKLDTLLITISETASTDYPTSGMLLFLDATGKTTSSTETVWEDKSGNGNDFTLAQFAMDGVDGWGNDELLLPAGSTGVIKAMASDTSIRDGGLENGVDGEATFFMRVNFTGASVYRVFMPVAGMSDTICFSIIAYRTAITFKDGITTQTLTFNNSQGIYITIGCRIQGTTVTLYARGSSENKTVSIVRYTNPSSLSIGSWVTYAEGNNAQQRTEGAIKQVLLYDRALTDIEVDAVITKMDTV